MKKGIGVRVIEKKEVRGDNPIKYFFPTGVRSTFGVPERRWQLKSSRMKRFMEEKKSRFCCSSKEDE